MVQETKMATIDVPNQVSFLEDAEALRKACQGYFTEFFFSYNPIFSLKSTNSQVFFFFFVIVTLLGWGTDEKAIISILGHRNAAQRRQIRLAYEELYQEDLIKRLESELSGDFEVNSIAIFYSILKC